MRSRSNPFDEFERLFDRLTSQFEDAARWWDEESPREGSGDAGVAVDVLDEPDELVVTVDVPGFDRNEIDVRLADNTLFIQAEHREETETGDETYLRRERHHESSRRSIRLPTAVDPEDVTARLRNGILTVTIPKSMPDEEARQIDIESD